MVSLLVNQQDSVSIYVLKNKILSDAADSHVVYIAIDRKVLT